MSARRSITKAQLKETAAVELLQLCQGITADGKLSAQEAASLVMWLRDNRQLDIPAAGHLRQVLDTALQDGHLSTEELHQIHQAVEAILPPDLRKDAIGARRTVQAAEKQRDAIVATVNDMIAGTRFDGRQPHNNAVRTGDPLQLARQPQNPHDRQAIAVLNRKGHHLGYLPRETADWLTQQLPRDARYTATAAKVLTGRHGAIPVIKAQFYGPEAQVNGLAAIGRIDWAPPRSQIPIGKIVAGLAVIVALPVLVTTCS